MAETERLILGYDELLLFQTEEDLYLAIGKIKIGINTKGSFSINELVHDWGFNTDNVSFNGVPYSYYPNKYKDRPFNDFEPIVFTDPDQVSLNARFGLRIFNFQPVSEQECGQTMEFPETVEEFMEQYKVVDSEQVYTNGSELIPIFRMKQWLEHLPANLNVYSIAFSQHKGKEWICNSGYIFAKDEESLEALLNKQYGEVRIRYARKIDIREGTILYGERWKTLNG